MADKQIKITMAINDKLTKPLRRMQEQINNMSFIKASTSIKQAFSGLAKHSGIGKVASATSNLTKGLSDVGSEAMGAALKIGGIAAAGIGGMAALVKQTSDYGSELIDVAKRINFGVEAFQEYRYAAEQSGVSNEDFVKGTEKFTRSLGEAKNGQGALFNFLKQTNPELLKQVLHAKTTEDAFGLVTKSLGGVKDASKQAMYTNLLFGKSGKNFVNLANEGGDGIDKLRKRARDLNLVMSEVNASKAEEFGDKWSTVSQVLVGLRNTIGVELMPVISELMDKFISWAIENKAAIINFAKTLAKKLPDAIKSIKEGFDSFMNGPIVGFIKWLGETFGYINVALIAVAAVIFGPLIASIAALIPLVWSLGVALLTTPIGWIIGGIAAMVAGFFILKRAFTGAQDGLTAFCQVIVALLLPFIGIPLLIKNAWVNNFLGIKDAITPVFDWIAQKFEKLRSVLPSWLGGKTEADININKKTELDAGKPIAQTISTAQTVRNYVQAQQGSKNETAVKVSFDNLPRGAKVETQASKGVDLSTDARMGMLGLPSY